MSASISTSDFDAFYAFLSELRSHGVELISPEESVRKFRESQSQLRKFQELNELAVAQSKAGLSKPVDIHAVLQRVEQRVQLLNQEQ